MDEWHFGAFWSIYYKGFFNFKIARICVGHQFNNSELRISLITNLKVQFLETPGMVLSFCLFERALHQFNLITFFLLMYECKTLFLWFILPHLKSVSKCHICTLIIDCPFATHWCKPCHLILSSFAQSHNATSSGLLLDNMEHAFAVN